MEADRPLWSDVDPARLQAVLADLTAWRLATSYKGHEISVWHRCPAGERLAGHIYPRTLAAVVTLASRHRCEEPDGGAS